MSSTIDPAQLESITTTLENVQRNTGLSDHDVFTSWLEFTVTSLARDNATYQDLIADLSPRLNDDTELIRDTLESYGQALGALVHAMEDTTVPDTSHPAELLGSLYEYYDATSDSFGQHFTPQPLAVMKARMLFPNADDIRDATVDDPITISDPTCGSGRLPFHALYRLRTIAPDTPAIIVGRDIDQVCAHMTVINFALHSMPAYVVHGNSLTYETWSVWRVTPVNRLVTNPETKGVVTELEPAEAPVTTSGDIATNVEDSPDTASETSGGDVAIDSDEITDSATLDAFQE